MMSDANLDPGPDAQRFAIRGKVWETSDTGLQEVLAQIHEALSAPEVGATALSTGDLVFFASDGQVTHVGIYVGDGRFIHAPRTGGTVRMERLDGRYWQARYAGARRVLGLMRP